MPNLHNRYVQYFVICEMDWVIVCKNTLRSNSIPNEDLCPPRLTDRPNEPDVGVAGRPSFAASLKELGLSPVGAAAFRQPKPLGVRRLSLCEKDEEVLSKELGRRGRITCFCT